MARLIEFLTTQNLFCDGCALGQSSIALQVSEQTSGTITSEHSTGSSTSDHAKAFCCNCNELLCQLCWDYHMHHYRFRGHHIVRLGGNVATQVMSYPCYNVFTCCEPGHEREALSSYCSSCSDVVCSRCKTADLHRDHSYRDVAEMAKEGRDKMSQVLDLARIRVKALTETLGRCSGLIEEAELTKIQTATVLNSAFDDVQRALEDRRKMLLSSLEELMLSKSESLKLHMEALNGLKQDISNCSDLVTNAHQLFSDEEVAAMKGIFPDRLQSILNESEIVPLSANVHMGIAVAMDTASLIVSIKQSGIVDDISPANCTWTVKLPFVVGVESKLLVQTRTSGDVKWACAGVQVQAELSEVSGSEDVVVAVGQDSHDNDGKYTVSLTPPAIGVYSLQVTVDGKHIRNSPCDVHVVAHNYSSLKCTNEKFSCALYSSTKINCMVIYSGRIYLSLWHNSHKYHKYCHISVYSLDGKREQTIGSYGNGTHDFDDPHGIAIYGDNMYVADRNNHRIQKLTISGTFVQSFGQDLLKYPEAIATISNHKILVATGTSEIQVFFPNGNVAESIRCASPTDGSIKSLCIYDIMVDATNNIHIASKESHHILVYSRKGCYIRKYGDYDCHAKVKLSKSENGCSIVCCNGYSSITQIFDMFGNQICSLKGTCSQFDSIACVVIDVCGNLYVTSRSCVTKWSAS